MTGPDPALEQGGGGEGDRSRGPPGVVLVVRVVVSSITKLGETSGYTKAFW